MPTTTPTDKALYDRVKRAVYKRIPVHSAYRSGTLVSEYKKAFAKKYKGMSPYIGRKPTSREPGLARWFREDWKSDTGKYGYTSKSSVYRPSVRVTKDTPTTFSELSPKRLRAAKRKKRLTGRVNKF